jgi:nitroimidazol reductase NimA-like FMN-containing flavoprotein (pyridoxamine 5'-phosphate oxidase superfamily)
MGRIPLISYACGIIRQLDFKKSPRQRVGEVQIKDIRMLAALEKEAITDIEEIEEIIKGAVSCRFGFVDGEQPYIAPAPFGYERGAFYFHGSPEDRKARIISKNNNVYFEITTDFEVVRIKPGEVCHWMTAYRRVIGTGKARVLQSREEKRHGLSLIVKQYVEGEFSFPEPTLDKALVVAVEIKSINGFKSG